MTRYQQLQDMIEYTNVDTCVEFTYAPECGGYGSLTHNNVKLRANRLTYAITRGIDIDGDVMPEVVRHTCDNPPCVNPHHLVGGTQYDNAQDRRIRNRTARNVGESNGRSKLTWEQVKDIRGKHAHGQSMRSLAREYSMSHPNISDIVNYRTWQG